jgi:ABC-type branched-subunit amino acid transport system ATPase component
MPLPGTKRAPGDMSVEVRDIDFSYGHVQVLFGTTFHVYRGEILGLLGTNGAGKSTVLRVLSGLSAPDRGTIVLDGEDVTGVPAEELCRRGVSLVMGGRAVFADLSVRENLELGGYTLAPAVLSERIEQTLARFPQLRTRLNQPAASLSGGEQQQLAVAKALLLDPKLLCLDELSLGLAPTLIEHMFDIVRALNAEGITCILVEQSLRMAASICHRAVFLEKGSVRFDGAPGDLLERGDLARAVFLGAGTARRAARRAGAR